MSASKLIEIPQFHSGILSENMKLSVWLPAGYSDSSHYAVLYMQDGENLFDSTKTWNHQEWKMDETISKLMEEGKIEPTIVVGIHNLGKRRFAQYFPKKVMETLSDSTMLYLRGMAIKRGFEMEPVLSDRYLQFLCTELKPFIDSNYATYRNREHTFIGGSSLGGLISMYALCEYPMVFGGAICMSSHWPGTVDHSAPEVPRAFVHYLANHLPAAETHKFYFDYGTLELDSLYAPYQYWVDSTLNAHGYGPKNWITKSFEGAGHNEQAWSARLHVPLEFMLGNGEESR